MSPVNASLKSLWEQKEARTMLWLARGWDAVPGVTPGLWHLRRFGRFIYDTGPPAAVGATDSQLHGRPCSSRAAVHAQCSSGPGLWEGQAGPWRQWPLPCSKPGATKGDYSLLFQVRGAQEVPVAPWAAWAAAEETEVASPHEGPGAPEETPPEEATCSTAPETGSAPTRTCSLRPVPAPSEEKLCDAGLLLGLGGSGVTYQLPRNLLKVPVRRALARAGPPGPRWWRRRVCLLTGGCTIS